jgi:meiotically up-regulated gene 157 (Mug157) protein
MGYFEATRDDSPFGKQWRLAMDNILEVILKNIQPEIPYTFRRNSKEPTETLLHGMGQPTRRTGLSRSPFRPSDDATVFPYLIPANVMAHSYLKKMLNSGIVRQGEIPDPNIKDFAFPKKHDSVHINANNVDKFIFVGLEHFSTLRHPVHGLIYAYEVDGYGSHYLADDANVPSLLSLPYFGYVSRMDETYLRTRKFLLSLNNPWFFQGKAAEGIGSPHGHGIDYIWPMSIIMRALTSEDEEEIRDCLDMLKNSALALPESDPGFGFFHESFQKDNPKSYTRSWFAWVNSLFGELIMQIADERPHILLRPE